MSATVDPSKRSARVGEQAPDVLLVDITGLALRRLEIAVGREIFLLFKTGSIEVLVSVPVSSARTAP